ncbi:MAG: RyR domain-containing protein [Thermodesulfobacteriota bacterium]
MATVAQRIVVAGDVTIDWLMWRVKGKDPGGKGGPGPLNWELYQGTRMTPRHGGTLLLARLVQEATRAQVLAPRLRNLPNIPPKNILHSMVLLEEFPYTTEEKDKKNQVFRVKQNLGYDGPEKGKVRPLKVQGDEAGVDLVVLDDAGNGFRDEEGVWPRAVTAPGQNPLVILKMSRPLQTGGLWQRLRRDHDQNLVVVVSANDLRAEGVKISRQLSWERTAMDFVWQMANNQDLEDLKQCRNLIVRFGLDGAIHYYQGESGPEAQLYYDPLLEEGGFKDTVGRGGMIGLSIAFVAALTARIVAAGLQGLGEGVRQGILSSRRLLKLGFGQSHSQPNYPGREIFQPLEGEKEAPIKDMALPRPGAPECAEPDYWTILGSQAQERLEEVADNFARTGTDTALDPVPVGRFGKLTTLDRTEIESLQSIKNLMGEYLQQVHQPRPLSLAVFGPPGSGKSFTATQVAESVAKDDIQRLDFNLSQWNVPEDLIKALHQVRDVVLKGKVPLVFFDEFDSKFRNEELGWLKYFLEPMQDGSFKEGETSHPIGRAIFVFAGGTCQTLQEFCREDLDKKELAEEQKEAIRKAFKDAKGPDFVSRLKGYVNILGLNPGETQGRLYLIRRALLLRGLLQRKASHLFDSRGHLQIDGGVLEALLKVTRYKHGARSLEAVVDMSRLSGRRVFEPAALPPAEQLRLHVEPEQFCRLLVQEEVFESMVEKLAQKIHEKFCEDNQGKKSPDDPGMQLWEKLMEHYKESNRNQAKDTKVKLKAIGYGVIPVGERQPEMHAFTPAEIETMAIMEHDRFMKERVEAGWRFGDKRNEKEKTHPCLLPWEELPEVEKDKDRNTVRRIPEFLAEIGFEVYPLVPKEASGV